jgi:hypothetical protein
MEDITLSWERLRVFVFGEMELEGRVGDWDIVSDEHCASIFEMEVVVGAGGSSKILVCMGALGAESGGRASRCCCSHISRVLGSTGQLEAVSGLPNTVCGGACGGDDGTAGEKEDASAGVSAFHHPIFNPSVFL